MQPPEIDGYQTRLLQSTKNEVIFRINIHSKKEFFLWKEKYCNLTSTKLNVKRTSIEKEKFKFYQLLVSQHRGRFRAHFAKHRKEDTK